MKKNPFKGQKRLFPNLRYPSRTLRLHGGMDRIGISTDIDDARIHKAIRKNLASKRGRRWKIMIIQRCIHMYIHTSLGMF
jgi:hypothetical protein